MTHEGARRLEGPVPLSSTVGYEPLSSTVGYEVAGGRAGVRGFELRGENGATVGGVAALLVGSRGRSRGSSPWRLGLGPPRPRAGRARRHVRGAGLVVEPDPGGEVIRSRGELRIRRRSP